MQTKLQIGDRVRYRAEFLRSIGQYTGPLPQAKGKIIAANPLGSSTTIATITWENDHYGEVPTRVNAVNLELVK